MSDAATVGAEWREGWRAVLASSVGICFCILHFYTLGVMLAPLSQAYGWSRSDITAAPVVLSVVNFFAAAAIGRRASRVGVRRIAIPGLVGYGTGLFMLGFAGPGLWSWYALWLLLALAYPFVSNSIWCLSVASRFNRSRGLALAVALCGTGVTSAVAPLATAGLIDRYGWSGAHHLLGLGALTIGLPLAWSLQPGKVGEASGGGAVVWEGTEPLPGLTFGRALRTRPFWILAFAAAMLGVGMPTLMVHFVPIGLHDGMGTRPAVAAAGLIGIAAIGGRLATGVLMDMMPGRLVASVLFAVPSLACLLLIGAHGSAATMAVAALAIGACTGAEFDVLAVLVSRYMGLREFAAINGQIAAIFGLGVGFGPAVGSLVYDQTQSYTPLLAGLAVAFLFPAALVLTIGQAGYPGRGARLDAATSREGFARR